MRTFSNLLTMVSAGVLVVLLLLGSPRANAADGTLIEPGKTFMLGGEQAVELQVRGRNTGNVPVEFLLMAKGKERSVAIVEPGKTFGLRVPAGNTALFRNASDRRATLKFELSEDISALSMRYDGQ
jgi:hypothetical protein